MKAYVCEGCGLAADPQNLSGAWRFDSKVPGLVEHAHGGIRYSCKAVRVVPEEAITEVIQPGVPVERSGAVEAAQWAVGRIGQLSERLTETIGREGALKVRVRRLEEAPCLPETERETALKARVHRLEEALRLTQEYVGDSLLPPSPGWSWFDALSESQDPAMRPRSAAQLAADLTGMPWGECAEVEPERALIKAREDGLARGGTVSWSPEHFPGEPVPRPPVGHVPYLPTHNHTQEKGCWIGCPVFAYEDYKKSWGDPFAALEKRTTQRNDALVALADIRAAAHNSWVGMLHTERVAERVDEVFDGLDRELLAYIGALRLYRSREACS